MEAEKQELQQWIAALTPEERTALADWCRVEVARAGEDVDSFAAFYRLTFGRALPRHARQEWLPALEEGRRTGKGVVIEAFRGSSKTTTLTVGWLAFRIGKQPQGSYLLVQAAAEAAEDSAAQVAALIEHNRGWRWVFPHVRPDRTAGWGLSGYQVFRTDMDYQEWRKLALSVKGKDPTLAGLGYRSHALIGKHPTHVLLVDDIHDENNTRSGRELYRVRQILMGTILPTLNPETMQVVVGTPWTENDVLSYLKASGRYLAVRTPVYRGVGDTPTWPERFTPEDIAKRRSLVGEKEFARMYLLDLSAASGVNLKTEWLHTFPAAEIDPRWPVLMGVDYASTSDKLKDQDRDYFALAVGRVLPGGGIVVVGGVRKHLMQAEAESILLEMAEQYGRDALIGVESVGKGEEFYLLMLRHAGLNLMPVSPGRTAKGVRFEGPMAQAFKLKRAWLSTAEDEFIKIFRDEWARWPNGEHDDTLDAVYWMLAMGFPHLLPLRQKKREKKHTPYHSLGRV